MEILNDKQNNGNNNHTAALLPSLFGNDVVAKDGLITINDSSLTQQIEFILQEDATIEENELEQQQQQQQIDNNPPNLTCAPEHQQNRSDEQTTTIASNNTAQNEQIFNGRGIIIQSTRQIQQHQQQQQQTVDDDPELNDENLQDIEAETQESEAELQQVDEQYPTVTQIKLQQYDTTINQYRATELVLPSGTIVRTSSMTALPALSTLQRRSLYINDNDISNTTTNIINMPTSIGTSVVVSSANHILPSGVSIVPLSNVANVSSLTATEQIFNRTNTSENSSTVAITKKNIVKKSSKKSSSVNSIKSIVVSPSNQLEMSNNNNNNNNNNRNISLMLCSDCPERFDTKELFDIHRSGHLNNMKCAICNMVLKSLKNYEKHCLRCKPYECQICGRIVRFRPNFIKHMRVHAACQATERHKYKCEVCQKEFMSFEYFKVHKKIHSENVNLTCEICGKVFSALASLRGHSKLHSGHKLHKCEVCGKGFGQRYNLKIHARTHTGDFPYECGQCKKKVHTEKALESHMKTHQRTNENNSASRNKNIKKSKMQVTRLNSIEIENNNQEYERPSTSGLQQLCAIASDNLKNFNDEIDSTSAINYTTDRETLISNDSQDIIQNNNNNNNNNNSENDNVNNEKLNASIRATAARTIVINNFVQNKTNSSSVNSVPTSKAIAVITETGQQQQQHTQVIQSCGNISNNSNSNNNNNNNNNIDSVLKQQLLRQTPIIQTTPSKYIVQNNESSSSPTTSSNMNHYTSTNNLNTQSEQHQLNHSSDRDISLDVDDDAHVMDAHDIVHQSGDGNSCNSVLANDNATIMPMTHHVPTIHHHVRQRNGVHFDDDTNDDEKSSPSLATTAIIKQEPNFYSSGSVDNSNEMLIKEEVIFEDSQNAHSPRTHSSLSSKFCMSTFDTDHHGPMDLNHTLPPYGHLFESHSIPDSIPFARMDDDDFQLDHSSLGGLHNTSNSTTDGEFIKKEWVYGAGNNFHMSGKFDEDTDPMCEPASFIYN